MQRHYFALSLISKAEKEVGKKKTTKKLEVEIEWLVGGANKKDRPMKIK